MEPNGTEIKRSKKRVVIAIGALVVAAGIFTAGYYADKAYSGQELSQDTRLSVIENYLNANVGLGVLPSGQQLQVMAQQRQASSTK